MIAVSFPNWSEALEAAGLPEKTCKSHRCVVLWFLGFLKREGKQATVAEARTFVEGLIEERKPKDWQVEQWRAGINWSRKRLRLTRFQARKRLFLGRLGGNV